MGKNFVVANAVETILAAPKRVTQGAKDYLNKEDFGKVPKYLQHIKQDIEAEYNYIASLQQQEEEMNKSAFAPMRRRLRLRVPGLLYIFVSAERRQELPGPD